MSDEKTLIGLNQALFMQLERLNNPELTGDALEDELKRGKGVTDVAKTIISNANLVLRARIAKDEHLGSYAEMPKMLGTSDTER